MLNRYLQLIFDLLTLLNYLCRRYIRFHHCMDLKMHKLVFLAKSIHDSLHENDTSLRTFDLFASELDQSSPSYGSGLQDGRIRNNSCQLDQLERNRVRA